MSVVGGVNLRGKIIVANTGEDSLSIIDSNTWIDNNRIHMPLGSGPYALAKTKDASNVLVSQYYGDSLLYIDLQNQEIKKSLFLGRRPSYMVADLQKNIIYISNMDSDSISMVEMDEIKLTGQVTVGSMPQGIDCYPDDEVLAVANTHSNSVYIINTFDYRILKTINLEGNYPFQVKYSLDGQQLFVGCSHVENQSGGSIIIINAKDYNISCEVPLTAIPGQIYQTQNKKYILATSMGNGGLQVIDIKKRRVIKNIATNGMTHGIAMDLEERYAYVTNSDDNSVSVVDWNNGTTVTSIEVGKEPNGIIFIPSDP